MEPGAFTIRDTQTRLGTALALGFLLPNEKVEQLAANTLTIPQDAIASLLQRLVRHALVTNLRYCRFQQSHTCGSRIPARPVPKQSRLALFQKGS